MKIVSLIPSATEIIFALDLCNNLVGVSHECDYPEEILKLPKLTTSRVKTEQYIGWIQKKNVWGNIN